MVTRKIKR